MLAGAVDRAGEAPADRMDFAFRRDHRHMVARLRQRRGLAPGVGRRIVDLVGRDRHALRVAPADGVHLAVENRDADRGARRFHRGEFAPAVGGRIVFIHNGLGMGVHRWR